MNTVTSANGITYEVTTSDTLERSQGSDDYNKVVTEYQSKSYRNLATGDIITITAEMVKTYISGTCELVTMRCWHGNILHCQWRIMNYCIERTINGKTRAWTRYAVPSDYSIEDAYFKLPAPKIEYFKGYQRKAVANV